MPCGAARQGAHSSRDARQSFSLPGTPMLTLGLSCEPVCLDLPHGVPLVGGLQRAAIVGGATPQEIASATLQLGQALAVGTLQGEELRAILEAMPPLAEALAARSAGGPVPVPPIASARRVHTSSCAARGFASRPACAKNPCITPS